MQRDDPQRKKIALVATAHYLVRVMWARLKRSNASGHGLSPRYLRLVGCNSDPQWEGRAHSFGAAAATMFSVLSYLAHHRRVVRRLDRSAARPRRNRHATLTTDFPTIMAYATLMEVLPH